MAVVPFTREPASEHAAEMIAWFFGLAPETAGRLTDFNPGSNIRTLIEAVAVRFEHLDTKAWLALQRAIKTILFDFFGEGDGITSFVGFPALPALPASGIVRYERIPGQAGAITIPVGSRLQVPAAGTTPARVYTTIIPLTLLDGQAAGDTLAQAAQVGVASNVAANSLQVLDAVPGILGATNPASFLNGAEAETDEARRLRFAQYIRELARCQLGGLEAGARTAQLVSGGAVTERVLYARAVPVRDKRGLVDVFVDNGGGTASPALVTAAQTLLDGFLKPDGSRVPGYKAAGEVVQVQAVVPQIVPVTVAIAIDAGTDFAVVQAAVSIAIEEYVAGLGVFTDLIVADLIAAIAGVRGVRDLTLGTPLVNVGATAGARLLPGHITVTAR